MLWPIEPGPFEGYKPLDIWPLCLECIRGLNLELLSDGRVQVSIGPTESVPGYISARPRVTRGVTQRP